MTEPSAGGQAFQWLGRPYLFRVGGIQVSGYLLMLYLGCVAGIAAGAAAAPAAGIEPQRFALAAIGLLVPAFIGARLWHFVLSPNSFRDDPWRVWRGRDGGAALDGGLVLCVASSVPVLAVAGISFWAFWDAAAITMLVGVIIARFGCLMRGCCAGRATAGPFGVRLPNHRGEWRRRFPTPLLESVWAAIVLAGALHARSWPLADGQFFAGAVMAYAIGRPLIALTRETDDRAHAMRISLAVSGALFAAAGAALISRWPA